ncbi:MAG TPA: hypothetical protein VFV67_16785 [Actinophytocola sp.]|uniref:hypothetical protein n=1 Tax=Actinophytocola sp. TaxID=1872138 RepID=UPI002DB87051|nr:hypothetical protein [Actinophytocola sp.]HEU5472309.1 hypothetical protein [Actinophytocola sp.]
MDDLPDRVFITLNQTGDRGHGVPACRGQDHHRPPQPDRRTRASAHDPLQPLTFLISQPPNSNKLCHPHSVTL